MGVLAQREILGVDFRTNGEAAVGALVRSAAGQGHGPAVPAGGVRQIQARAHQAPGGVEGGVAPRGPRPGRPVLALGPPVEAQFDQIGGNDLLGLGLRILEVRRGEGQADAQVAVIGAHLEAAGHSEAFGAEAVGVGLVLVGVEGDLLQPGAALTGGRRGVAADQGAGHGVHAARQRQERPARVLGQELLVQIDEIFAPRLADEGVQQVRVRPQGAVEGVEDAGFRGDQPRLLSRAAPHVEINLARRGVGRGVHTEEVGRVGFGRLEVDVAQREGVGVYDREARRRGDQGGEAHPELGSVLQVRRSRHRIAAGRARGSVDREDEAAVPADGQVGDAQRRGLTPVKGAVLNVDRQLPVGVGQAAGDGRPAGDRQAVRSGPEVDRARDRAIAHVDDVGSRPQQDVSEDGGFGRVGDAVAV